MTRLRQILAVGKEFEIQAGLCTVRHNISCPFDNWKVTGITDGELYKVLMGANEVLVLEPKGEADTERLLVTIGPLTFTVYQATL